MAVLKSLTFTTIPNPGGDPVLDRRTKLIARLEEQKLILKDPNYTRIVRNWVKKDGERVMVEKQQRVPLWWRQHPNGSYALFVRSGLKPIEFEKGKAAISVPSLDKLPSVIDTLITAVRNGELDEQLVQGSKVGMVKKTKAA
ncbi:DUF6641 family protein [Bradyrhizobium sp.]|uniref:DUF6641 family protein n=1 Tax=Bradyrhizobium sp. TaxID=376 RepID=UPI003BAE7FFC